MSIITPQATISQEQEELSTGQNIFRVKKDPNNPYVMVNKSFVEDHNLSAKSKGILLYLLSKPDNWRVYEKDIVNHMSDGREAIRSGLKELEENGYIEREEKRDQKGRFRGYNYRVYEFGNRSGFSDIGETAPSNKNLNNNYKREGTGKFKKFLHSKTIDFKTFKSMVKVNGPYDKEKLSAVEYFLEEYKKDQGEDHPPLTFEKWNEITKTLFKIKDDFGEEEEFINAENIKNIIDRYFKIKFRESCNYRLPHFNSLQQKANRFFEVAYYKTEPKELAWDYDGYRE